MVEPAKQVVKIVRLIKPVKVKPEVKQEVLESDEAEIPCRLCTKSFFNALALKNHLRMEHSGEEVDLQAWVRESNVEPATPPKTPSKKVDSKAAKEEKAMIARRTQQLVSSMKPENIMSLANKDVSYIIIKAEDGFIGSEPANRKRKPEPDETGPGKKPAVRKPPPHREIVPISGPFECLQPSTLVAEGTCHQIFFSCCDYSIHYRDEHTRRRKAIKCQVCEKVLASAIGEEPNSPYPCQVCGTGFQNSKDLTAHVNTAHIKLKPFECTICHKRFTQQGGVAQHMRMHTGDRPFPCSYCDKAFTQKSGLEQHLRTHTKVKPYRCVICSKTFIQSVHLKQHMRTHTHVAPFGCVVCDKRFKQSSHLNYHLKNHNEMNMTDDQKRKYHELLGMIEDERRTQEEQIVNQEELERAQNIIVQQNEEQVVGDESSVETVLIEQPEDLQHQEELEQAEDIIIQQHDGEQTVEDDSNVETLYIEQNEDGQDQIVLQDDREYILSDNGDETWSVRLVE